MIEIYKTSFPKCSQCESTEEGIYNIVVNNDCSFKLCPKCRRDFIKQLVDVTPDTEQLIEPHGGKWFEIWKDDKEGIITTMYKNLTADLDAGYPYSGRAIQSQLEAIEEYKNEYYADLDKFVTMSDEQVSRWCYYDLKKRGAIA